MAFSDDELMQRFGGAGPDLREAPRTGLSDDDLMALARPARKPAPPAEPERPHTAMPGDAEASFGEISQPAVGEWGRFGREFAQEARDEFAEPLGHPATLPETYQVPAGESLAKTAAMALPRTAARLLYGGYDTASGVGDAILRTGDLAMKFIAATPTEIARQFGMDETSAARLRRDLYQGMQVAAPELAGRTPKTADIMGGEVAQPSAAKAALQNIAEGKPAGAPRVEPPPLDEGARGAPPADTDPDMPQPRLRPDEPHIVVRPGDRNAPPADTGPLGQMSALDRLRQLAGVEKPPEVPPEAPSAPPPITRTSPEPPSDIAAQLRAVSDPEHPKDTMFAGAENVGDLPERLPPHIQRVDTPHGTLLTTNPEKARAFDADPSDETLARVLGYPQSKADVLQRLFQGDEPRVVEARDADGNVITQALASASRLDETKAALAPHAGPGGRVDVLDPMQVQQQRRQAQAPAETPPQTPPQPQGALPARVVKQGEAVTSTGRALPVDYAIVDARDLVTSHSDDLTENPAYPQGVQPRDRTRGATELQMNDMLSPAKFRPELLGESPDAANGAPIVGADGVVESGNMRSMALRRAYDRNLPAAEAYRDYLEKQGYPVQGVEQPVLVRVNRGQMDMAEREAFAREANKPAQLAMSATERALADAKALPDHVMDLARPEDFLTAGNRPFVVAALRSIASQAEMGALIGKDGALSAEGLRRVQGAVLAKAYDDASIIGTLLESTDGNYKAIGNALLEAAPGWAKMRAAARSGQIPPEFDVTPNLIAAVNVIGHARATGRNVAEFVRQTDMLSGRAVAPETELMLQWMLRGSDFGRAIGRQKVADALHFYAREALKVEPGESMFGDKTTPQQLVEGARVRAQGSAEPDQAGLAFREAVGQSPGAGAVRQGADPLGPQEPGRRPGAAGQGGDQGGRRGPLGFAEDRDLFDKTEQGEQRVLPGAGHETPEQVAARQRQAQKAEAELRMRGRLGAKRAQEAPDSAPLFGGKGKQGSLFEAPRLPGKARAGETPNQANDRTPLFNAWRKSAGFLDDGHAAARGYVMEATKRDGFEHGVMVDEKGNAVEATTSLNPKWVDPGEVYGRAFADPNRSITFHHTHPSGFALSDGDQVQLGFAGVHQVVAHGINGEFSSARLVPEVRQALHQLIAKTGDGNAGARLLDAMMRSIKAQITPGLTGAILTKVWDVSEATRVYAEILARSLAHAGLTDYVSTHALPSHPLVDRLQRAADDEARRLVRIKFGALPDRPTTPVRAEEGMARLSGRNDEAAAGRRDGPNGGGGGAPPAGYRKPQKLKLLESRFAESGLEEPPGALARLFARIPRADRLAEHGQGLLDLGRSIQMALTPMARGTVEARAVAKDFANAMRLSRFEWNRVDDWLKTTFKPEQLQRMWEAADEESVARQQGQPTAGIGLARLSPDERAAVEALQGHAQAAFETARQMGMVEGEGLPSYTPRMVVDMGEGHAQRLKAKDEAGTGNPLYGAKGRNLRTTTPQLRQRDYLTTEETEAAARAKFGEGATVVRDIRTLALATAKLHDAIAGRGLINAVKEAGKRIGEETVHEGALPTGTGHRWFTLEQHPAFKVWRRFETDAESGKVTVAKDAGGKPIFERVPLYVRDDFEGPLKAVLSQDTGKVYNALMTLKGKTMGVVMYSPVIHNAVEWGRALPAMPGKVATFRVYFEGNRAKNDPATMREAIGAGVVPIGHRGGMQDITSMMEEPNVKPGRSWTAQLLGAVPGLFDPRAGEAVKRAVDRAGDFWHNTLLWDRVGDLQMGLYVGLRDHMIEKGLAPADAQRVAAHFANRYAGALPQEAMSTAARQTANLALFSRSFTLGNLGAMKDAVKGLPRDVQAQILRQSGEAGLKTANALAQRKAAATLLMDVGLMYAGNAILQSAIAILSGDQSLDDEARGYARRFGGELQHLKENPLDVLNPFGVVSALTPMADNEPGKQDRIKVGHAADGTAIYMRNPAGKIGEEFQGWLTGPLDMLRRKLGTIARPIEQTIANDQGFGRKVYDPDAKTPAAWAQNIGRIATLFLGDQVPLQALQGARDWYAGRGDATVDAAQVLGPVAGLTFSKGAPGGEAQGELYQAKREHEFQVQQALPAIRRQIKDGDLEGAREQMRSLGIPPKLQQFYIDSTLHPSRSISRRQLHDFMGYGTPEQQERFNRAREQQ